MENSIAIGSLCRVRLVGTLHINSVTFVCLPENKLIIKSNTVETSTNGDLAMKAIFLQLPLSPRGLLENSFDLTYSK